MIYASPDLLPEPVTIRGEMEIHLKNRILIPKWSIPFLLLGVSIIAYGIYSWQIGYYWNDWGFAWTRAQLGFKGLQDLFSITRPPRAIMETILTPILGVHPFAWQVFAILLHWMTAVSLWWFLRQVWPDHEHGILLVTLFFLVYPGFGQQSLAMVYDDLWILETFLFISLGLMVWAIRTSRYFWVGMIGSVLLSALQLFSMEYLFGVELLRLTFIWIVLGEFITSIKQRIRRMVLIYLPFAVVVLLFLYWRVFVYTDTLYHPVLLNTLIGHPGSTIANLLNAIIYDSWLTSVQAWMMVLHVLIGQQSHNFNVLYTVIVIGSLVFLMIYLSHLNLVSDKNGISGNKRYRWHWIGIGLLGIILAGIPFYAAGLRPGLLFPDDRFTSAYAFGVSLLLTGIIELLSDWPRRLILASVLIALAIGLQVNNTHSYRDAWNLEKDYLWQMTWRMPGIQPGTMILSDDFAFPYTEDDALTFMTNWTFDPDNHTNRLAYAHFYMTIRLGVKFSKLAPHVPAAMEFDSAHFVGSTDRSLVIHYSPPSCLRILDPVYDQNLVLVNILINQDWQRPDSFIVHMLPPLTLEALPLSNLDMVITDPKRPALPPSFIGSEPEHSWCYYFEKADIARQKGDWTEVAVLGEQAFSLLLYPGDLSEYLPFIEAYARLGNLAEAKDMTDKISHVTSLLNPMLCSMWQRVETAGIRSSGEQAAVKQLQLSVCGSSNYVK